MHASRYVYPLSAAREVASWLDPIAARGRPGMEHFMSFEAVAPGGALAAGQTYCHARAIAFQSDAGEATALLEAIDAAAPAGALDRATCLPVTYERLYASSVTGPVLRVLSDTMWTEDGVAAATRLAASLQDAPGAQSIGLVNFRAAPRPLPDAAMSVAGSAFVTWAAQWTDPAHDAENARWADATTDGLDGLRTGCYVNETDILRHPERARHCYSAAAWERMAAVRARYDPHGLFPSAY
jgi:FAD/FMN-containing dehydrogenase